MRRSGFGLFKIQLLTPIDLFWPFFDQNNFLNKLLGTQKVELGITWDQNLENGCVKAASENIELGIGTVFRTFFFQEL